MALKLRSKENQASLKNRFILHFTKLDTDIPLSNLGIQKVDGKFK